MFRWRGRRRQSAKMRYQALGAKGLKRSTIESIASSVETIAKERYATKRFNPSRNRAQPCGSTDNNNRPRPIKNAFGQATRREILWQRLRILLHIQEIYEGEVGVGPLVWSKKKSRRGERKQVGRDSPPRDWKTTTRLEHAMLAVAKARTALRVMPLTQWQTMTVSGSVSRAAASGTRISSKSCTSRLRYIVANREK